MKPGLYYNSNSDKLIEIVGSFSIFGFTFLNINTSIINLFGINFPWVDDDFVLLKPNSTELLEFEFIGEL